MHRRVLRPSSGIPSINLVIVSTVDWSTNTVDREDDVCDCCSLVASDNADMRFDKEDGALVDEVVAF